MAGALRVRITRSAGEIHDLRYRYIWSAWRDGRLIGKGHAFKPEAVEAWVLDLLSPDAVDLIEVVGP